MITLAYTIFIQGFWTRWRFSIRRYSTFLLQDGQVLREWRKVKADGHAAVVLSALPE